MAVIQISRIQHRRGLADELPNALAEGELGFATDTGELFIGASSTDLVANRTAFPYKNIKILTEFDVQRSVTGDVYYHGPLKAADVFYYSDGAAGINLALNQNKIPLFHLDQASYGIYDFSISVKESSIDADGNPNVTALHCGMITVAAGLPGNPISTGLTASSGVNGDIPVMSGSPALYSGGSPLVSLGSVVLLAVCEPDKQVYLHVVHRYAPDPLNVPILKFHFSGREWLAGHQV